MSIRSVRQIFPHPNNIERVILALDDGYPLVLSRFDAQGIHQFDVVEVSGPNAEIDYIMSYGNFAQPMAEVVAAAALSQPRRLGCTLSAAFSGLQHKQMFGDLHGDNYKHTDNEHIDATSIVITEADKWVAFAGSKEEGMCCFDIRGNLIRPRSGEYQIWTRLSILDNFYTFCGILHRPSDGGASSFEIHCIWNRILCEPVGPPDDRRIAYYINIPFAKRASLPPARNGEKILIRVDNHTPIIN